MDEDALAEYQQKSPDIIVYSRLVERVVTLYCQRPTFKGTKILDTGIKQYERTRGLFIECFCAFSSDVNHPRSCQIVVSEMTKEVHGFCHYDKPRCSFHRMKRKSAYATRRHSSPYVRIQKEIPTSNSRYVEIDDFHQLHRSQARTAPARIPAQNTIAGPSRLPMESVSHPAPFPLDLTGDRMDGKEARYLRKLIAGQGISPDVWDGLAERCSKCKLLFTCSALKDHIKRCLGEVVVL
ncbi:hypothetical protein B0H17DRAFT_1151731 [Mycena rosella]|uniref:Uncharacterized protein n=1 Tax=Mycena rosella TaxID=1033263 RepID=A0AAD7BIK8_MYCRO|nr:hypothetical protein B0H17DRAFT_1151731 [Mycena rosella]